MAKATLERDCLTVVMTRVRMRKRSDKVSGEVADSTRNAHIPVAMEIAVAVNPIAADTAHASTLACMEKMELIKRRKRREAPTAALGPRDRRSRIE